MRTSNCMLPLAAATLLAAPGVAQTDDKASDDLVAKRDAKLAEPWIRLAPWTTDFGAAKAAAKKNNKMIFAYFSRSFAP